MKLNNERTSERVARSRETLNVGCALRTDRHQAVRRAHLTISRLLAAFLLSAVWVSVFAVQVQEDPLERQVLDISKDLRCAVCQNQPISESNADLARDMRDIIRDQIKAGKSREEIIQYFVDRYGDYVLMRPPVEGPGALLWMLPIMLAPILAAAAFFYLKHRQGRELSPPPKLSKSDLERVQRARETLEP